MDEFKKNLMKDKIKSIIENSEVIFKEKPFCIKHIHTFFITKVVSIIFQAFSFVAAFMYVNKMFENITNSFVVSCFFTTSILLIIELLKHTTTKTAFIEIVKKRHFSISAIPVIILMSISMYLSVNGIIKYSESQIVEIEYMPIDRSIYNIKIDSINTVIKNIEESNNYKKPIWSQGENIMTLSKTGVNLISGLKNEQSRILKDMENKEDKAFQEFIAEQHISRVENQMNINSIAAISFLNEVFYICSILFLVYYLHRSILEKDKIKAYTGQIDYKELSIIPEKEIAEIVKPSIDKYKLTGFQLKKRPNKTYIEKYPNLIKDIIAGDLTENQMIKKHNISRSTIQNIKRSIQND